MSSTKRQTVPTKSYKYKVCLLGGLEKYKDEFQIRASQASLSPQNKSCIGVNISKINYQYDSITDLLVYLWNVNCKEQWASYRTSFFQGTEAIIVFISEKKIEQILDYFEEIQTRIPVITVIFCVILEDFKEGELREILFGEETFRTLINSNNIRIESISSFAQIYEQITSNYLIKKNHHTLQDDYHIDFIKLEDLIPGCSIHDNCFDYNTPKFEGLVLNKNRRINTEILIDYLRELNFNIEIDLPDWVRIHDNVHGIFSIFLRNGRVYLIPKICQECRLRIRKKCIKFQKSPHFICIEAKEPGWSNIKGFDTPELLLLSKIFALKTGKLPKEVMDQIFKINSCVREK